MERFEHESFTTMKSAGFGPVTETAPVPNTRSAFPALVIVSVWTDEVVPVSVSPIEGVDAENTGSPKPVAARFKLFGLSGLLLSKTRVAARWPRSEGVKLKETVQVARGTRVWFEHLSLKIVKSSLFCPDNDTELRPKTRLAEPLFVTVAI